MLKSLAVALYFLQALCAVQLVMAQSPPVVLLPCGVETEYNALTALDSMQLIIRNCTGSRVDGNGVQVFVGTYLSLNFGSPLTPPPKNVMVLVENSVSVNVQIIGGNGSSPPSLISGFTIIMRNVSNPYLPRPQVTCAADPKILWCLDVLYLSLVSLENLFISLSGVSLNRTAAASTVVITTSALNHSVILIADTVQASTFNPVVFIRGTTSAAPISVSNAVALRLTLRNATMYAIGPSSSGGVLPLFASISDLTFVDTVVELSNVQLIDVGIVGSVAGFILTPLLAESSNVSIMFVNASAVLLGSADYTSLYLVSGLFAQSQIVLRNHTILGSSGASITVVGLSGFNATRNTSLLIQNGVGSAGRTSLYVHIASCLAGNSEVMISDSVMISKAGGNAVQITSSSVRSSYLSNSVLFIVNCNLYGPSASVSLYVMYLSCAMQQSQIRITNVSLVGNTDAGIFINALTAEHSQLTVQGCALGAAYPFLMQYSVLRNSIVEVTESQLTSLGFTVIATYEATAVNSMFTIDNLSVGSPDGGLSVNVATLVYFLESAFTEGSVVTIRYAQRSEVHAGLTLFAGSFVMSGASAILVTLTRSVLFLLDTNAVVIDQGVFQDESTLTIFLPPNTASLAANATKPFILIQHTILRSGSCVTVDGKGTAAVTWSSQVIVFFRNMTLTNSSSISVKHVRLRNMYVSAQLPSTSFAVVMQQSTVKSNSSVHMANLVLVLANVSRSPLISLVVAGVSCSATSFDASTLSVDQVRCQPYTDDGNTFTEKDPPGLAFCVLLRELQIRNGSAAIVKNITSINTNAFQVLQLTSCVVQYAHLVLLANSSITLLPSASFIGISYDNLIAGALYLSASHASLSFLGNTSIDTFDSTTVTSGPAPNYFVVQLRNCTLNATSTDISSISNLAFPVAQCDSLAAIQPKTALLFVVNTSVSGGNATFTVRAVSSPERPWCGRIVLFQSNTVAACAAIAIAVDDVHWGTTARSLSLSQQEVQHALVPLINVTSLDLFGNDSSFAIRIAALSSSSQLVLVDGARHNPDFLAFARAPNVRIEVSNSALTQSSSSLMQSVCILNLTRLTGVESLVSLINSSFAISSNITAVLCISNTTTPIAANLVSSHVQCPWSLPLSIAGNATALRPTFVVVESSSNISITLDQATLIGSCQLVDNRSSAALANQPPTFVPFVALYCSYWQRHRFSPPLLLTREASKSRPFILPMDDITTLFFPFSNVNKRLMCPSTQLLDGTSHTVSASVSNTINLPFVTSPNSLSSAQKFFGSVGAVTVTSSVSSAVASAAGTALIRTAFTAQLASCATGSVESIVSGDNGGNNFFELQIGEDSAPGQGYRGSVVGVLIIVAATLAFGGVAAAALMCRTQRPRTLREATAAAALPGWWLAGPCAAAVGPLLSSGVSLARVSNWDEVALDFLIVALSLCTTIVVSCWSVLALLKPHHHGLFVGTTVGFAPNPFGKNSSAPKFIKWLLDGGYLWGVNASHKAKHSRMYLHAYGSLFTSMHPQRYWHFLVDTATNLVVGIIAAVPAFMVAGTTSESVDNGSVITACAGALHATTAIQILFSLYFIVAHPVAVRWEFISGAFMVCVGALNALLSSIQVTSLASDAVNEWANAVQWLQLVASGISIILAVSECMLVFAKLQHRRALLRNVDEPHRSLIPSMLTNEALKVLVQQAALQGNRQQSQSRQKILGE